MFGIAANGSRMGQQSNPTTRDERGPSRIEDVRWGVKWGVLLAAGYFPIGLIKVALTQGQLGYDTPFLIKSFFGFLIVGGLVGCCVGLLRPLLCWGKWGAALVGILLALPLISITILTKPDIGGTPLWFTLGFILVASAVFGGIVGLGLYYIMRE